MMEDNFIKSQGNGISETHNIPEGLSGIVNYKTIIDSFSVIQVGDLVAQMTLQGRDGMASCRCLKCNLTKQEWQSSITPQLLLMDDVHSPTINSYIGQKKEALWRISPENTVVPILHCQLGTVNDQLFKKLLISYYHFENNSFEWVL